MDGRIDMDIMACDLPKASLLDSKMIESAYFSDSYSAPLINEKAGIVEIFFGIFGHHPKWMKIVIIIRNKIVSLFGLDTSTSAEILQPQIKSHYAVGDKIGPWSIYHLTQDELVAGRDNKHLDFRLSVLRMADAGEPSVVVSTICNVHNLFGKVYLFFIVPFHKWGVRKIIENAVLNGRL
jgi:hypothetical protein